MKRIYLFLAVVVSMFCAGLQNVSAQNVGDIQDLVRWRKYAVELKDVQKDELYFLYNLKSRRFFHLAGPYGVHAVGQQRGIPMYIEKAEKNDTVFFKTALSNEATDKGSYVYDNNQKNGCIFGDGGRATKTGMNEYAGWLFTEKERTFTYDDGTQIKFPAYKFYVNVENTNTKEKENRYMVLGTHENCYGSMENATGTQAIYVTTTLDTSTEELTEGDWAFIPATAYREVIRQQLEQSALVVTGVLRNTRFIRNAYTGAWVWTDGSQGTVGTEHSIAIHPTIGTISATVPDSYTLTKGAFGTAEIDHEKNALEQTVKGVKPGLYAMEIQGLFYDEDNAETEINAYFYMKQVDEDGKIVGTEIRREIPVLESTDRTKLEELITKHKETLGETYGEYFLYNVPVGEFLANSDMFAYGSDKYVSTIYFTVTPDYTNEKGEQVGDIVFGFRKEETAGRAFMDNVKVYSFGEMAIGLSAYEREKDNVDYKKGYDVLHTFHLSRHFSDTERGTEDENGSVTKQAEWVPIILPVDLPGVQLIRQFGKNVQLAKLMGVHASRPNQIWFKPVDLEKEEFKANTCYLLKVYKEYDTTQSTYGKIFSYANSTGSDGSKIYKELKYGSVYTFSGVNWLAMTEEALDVEQTVESVKFNAHYYRKDAPKGSYVMQDGKLHYMVNQPYTGLMATCWYLTDARGETTEARPITLAIEGEDGDVTDIEGVVTEVAGKSASAEGVYNLNGQKVTDGTSVEGLAKGVYIVNGKKRIVR